MACGKLTLDSRSIVKLKTVSALRDLAKDPTKVEEFVDNLLKSINRNNQYELNSAEEFDILNSTITEAISNTGKLDPISKEQINANLSGILSKRMGLEIKTTEIPEPTIESPNHEEDSNIKLTTVDLDDFYGSAFIVKEYMLNNFQNDLLTHCLINFEKAYIISNDKDLNNEIQDMKRNYFFILQNFLGIPTKELFINGKIDNVTFARVMELAKQEFAKLDRDNVTYAFNNIHVVNREGIKYNESLINAFNAYAVLSNFDNLVEKILGSIVSVNKVGSDSVYSLTIKNALSKNWTTTEETDAMKELGKFSRLLIETCPLLDRDTHTKLGYVNMSSFLGVTSKLRNESILSKLRNNKGLYDIFIKFHTAPSYYLPKIIEAVLAGKLNGYITFSRTDLNVLTSIYERFYNKNGKSLYNVMRNVYQNVRTSFDILESIAEIVDRSCGNYYIQYVRSEDGIKVKEVTRINKDRESIRKQNAINIYNQYRTDKKSIVEKYNITESKGGTITAKIPLDNGETFTVSVKNNDVTIPDDMRTFMPDFRKLIDRYDIGNSVLFDEQELKYIKLLEFIDSFLDTRFLTGNIQVLNKLVDNGIDYLRSNNNDVGLHLNGLIQAALTAGNALRLQLEYDKLENADLQTFLRNNSKYYNNKLRNKVHGYLDGKTILTVDATTNNKLEALINAEQELLGTPYKTTSKNLEGNNIPLNGISNLASYFTYFVNKVINSDTYRNTAFGEEGIAALNGVIAKNGGENRHGTTKSISQFSVAELAYTSIIYDYFHNRFSDNPEVLIQPTTYSDKSKIFLFKVLLNHLKNKDGVSFKDMTISQLKQFKRDTIKSFYKAVEARVLSDYRSVFSFNPAAFTEILNRDGIPKELKTKSLDDYTMDDFAKVLSVVEYWEYADLSWAAGVDNVENIHVCKNKKNNFLKPNNDLRYKAEILYDDDNVFNMRDQKERKDFLVDLINNNVVFPIKLKGRQYNEDLTYILNPGRLNIDINSEEGWNDKNTQNLILAKDKEGNPIKSVEDIKGDFELNPMLERYFYEYSTLAENIRLLLTGSEIAHPFKSNSDYSITDASFDQFIEEESTRAKAQLKRNVIVPATLLHFAQNSFMGIPSKYRIAVMEDFPANVYTFKGDSTSIDSMDGSAIVHPVIAILENYSLQDNAVGLNKKPIGHGISSLYGNAQLLKFATFGMDNEWIRKSNLSTIKFKQLLGRMNLDWIEDIDLTKNIYGKPIKVTDMTNGERLYFNHLGKHYEVGEIKKVGINKYNINYYEVNENGNRIDIEGTPVIIQKQDVVINNLTSLWEALGGEYSESLNNNELTFSNASWFAVANYVNWVGEFKGEVGDLPNQSNTYQPLKKTMIAYLCNKSAIKVGATNVNRKTSWVDNSPLRYFNMDTDGLGVQMDADHHADESEMTEFTQVISSLEANGYLHDISKLTYEDLGKATLSIIKDEVKAVDLYLKTYNKSDMYELIGRDLIKNIRSSDNKVGLSQSIIDVIREEFKRVQKSHVNDEFKIPFSDSNIQAISLSTFTSRLNSTTVKKKHPGSGMVMVPGFGTIQNFWLNGECYSYDDIYRMANSQNKTPEEFLADEQAKQQPLPIDQLLPGDKIIVVDESENRLELNIDTIEEYQRVKRTYSEFYPDVTKGQDLKPAQVYWEAGNKKFNMFDMPAIIRAIQIRSTSKPDKATDLQLQKDIQDTFMAIDKGFMPLTDDMKIQLAENPEEFKSEFGDISYLNGIQVVEIRNLVNKPAELVVSKLYATKFHLGANDTIASIKEEGVNYFIKKYDRSHILTTNQYDIAFTKGDGNHTYIIFNTDPVGGIKIEDNDNIKRTGNSVWRTDNKGHKLYKLSENGVILIEEFDVSGTKVLKTNRPEIINQIWKSDNYDTIVYGESENTDIITNFLKEGSQDNYLSKITELSRNELEEFNKRRKSSLCKKQYVSFLKSLEFTASRIPAQTLQSFMKMEVKQFMSTDKNIAIVTPFQAYLQGSDYSIKCGIR